jgi:hypothetical protein
LLETLRASISGENAQIRQHTLCVRSDMRLNGPLCSGRGRRRGELCGFDVEGVDFQSNGTLQE